MNFELNTLIFYDEFLLILSDRGSKIFW